MVVSFWNPVVPKENDDEDVVVLLEVVGANILDVDGANILDFEKVGGFRMLEVLVVERFSVPMFPKPKFFVGAPKMRLEVAVVEVLALLSDVPRIGCEYSFIV